MEDWDDNDDQRTPPIGFEGPEWFADIQPFSCPGGIAGQLARKKDREETSE